MRRVRYGAVAVAAILTLGGLFAGGLAAQDATPAAGETHPAHIHEGRCPDVGDVAFPLNEVGLAPEDGTPVAAPTMMEAMHDVESSVTTVDIALGDLLAGEYAINVHASPERIGEYIACGDVVGTVRQHRRSEAPPGLVIPLRQVNESGYAGIAWLEPTAEGATTVTIFLATDLLGPGPMGGTPAA